MVSETETLIFDYLAPFFREYQFEALPQKKQFRRSTVDGFSNVIFSVTYIDTGESAIEVNIGNRLHLVEKLVEQFVEHKHHHESNTIITSIGRLQGRPYFRYKARTEADIKQVCDQLIAFMEPAGLVFLENHAHLKQLDKVFNDAPLAPCHLLYNQMYRCLRGVVIGKLSNRDNFTDLAGLYRLSLEKQAAPEQLKEGYERLAKYLSTFSTN